jgi:DNA-binding XRE family transcriptional regulator
MNQLKEFRKRAGLSQLGLAKLTNIAPTDISRIENEWLRPYPGWRQRLAKALEVSEKEIFPNELEEDVIDRP